MVALARSLTVTTIYKARDPAAPVEDRTGFRIVGDEISLRRSVELQIPEAADLDLIVIEPPQEWRDEACEF